MTIARLIAELESRSIMLSLDGDQIRYRSPKQALTDSDRDALRARRGEIVDYLKARNAARGLRAASPTAGPLTPSVAQEMWRAFAGGAAGRQAHRPQYRHGGPLQGRARSRHRRHPPGDRSL